MGFEETVEWLSTLPGVKKVVIMEGDSREALFTEEASVGTSMGMPLVNESLMEAQKRAHNIAISLSVHSEFPIPMFSSILMKDPEGRIRGREVHDDDEKLRLDTEGKVVWLSEDFAVDCDADFSEMRFVLPAVSFKKAEEETGARNAILMFPSPSTCTMMGELFGFDLSRDSSMVVVSFDC